MSKISEILDNDERIIGMWGYPHPNMLNHMKNIYKNHKFVDFDVNYNVPSSNILPEAYCRIILNIIDNAIHLKGKTDLILASIGEEKCDSGRLAAKVLKDLGFNVVETRFEEYTDAEIQTPISTSNLPLKTKIISIMDEILEPQTLQYSYCEPTAGFWGVPPNDATLLELFPDTTHVYGWTRCVEAKKPADLDLEMFVDESVPTVFFSQTFCAKMQIAKYLAKKYNGLYVDVDDTVSNSVKAKIEAFIRLG